MTMRIWETPFSTNVERVTLALAYKGLEVEHASVPYDQRAEVVRVSGQELVPVLEVDGQVLVESMEIVRWLDLHHPEPPLYPREPARRTELAVFVDWFDSVWKRPPNRIAAELEKAEPDAARVEEQGRWLTASLEIFEELLDGRDHLFGDDFSAADVCAFPFLKYAVLGLSEGDDDVFHRVLVDHLAVGYSNPNLEAWVRRVDERPRA